MIVLRKIDRLQQPLAFVALTYPLAEEDSAGDRWRAARHAP
jgi:hypothetical protein